MTEAHKNWPLTSTVSPPPRSDLRECFEEPQPQYEELLDTTVVCEPGFHSFGEPGCVLSPNEATCPRIGNYLSGFGY